MGTRRSPTAQLRSAATALGPAGKIVEHTLFTYGTVTGSTDVEKAFQVFYGNWLSNTYQGAAATHQPMGFDQMKLRYDDVQVLDTTFEFHIRPAIHDTSANLEVPVVITINMLPIVIEDYTSIEAVATKWADMERVGAMSKTRIAALDYGVSSGGVVLTQGNPNMSKMVFKLKTKDILPMASRTDLTQHNISQADGETQHPPTELWGLRVFVSVNGLLADGTAHYDWVLKRIQRVVWSNRLVVTTS